MSDTKQKEILTTNNTIDLQIAMKIVRIIMTPFDELDAYKLGIIDGDGNQIKQPHEINTDKEKHAFSPLMKLLIRIKQLFIKYNVTRAQAQPFVTLAGALKFVRESHTTIGFDTFVDNYKPTEQELKLVKLIVEEVGTSVATIPVGRTNDPTDGPITPLNMYRRKNLKFKPQKIKNPIISQKS